MAPRREVFAYFNNDWSGYAPGERRLAEGEAGRSRGAGAASQCLRQLPPNIRPSGRCGWACSSARPCRAGAAPAAAASIVSVTAFSVVRSTSGASAKRSCRPHLDHEAVEDVLAVVVDDLVDLPTSVAVGGAHRRAALTAV